MATRVSRVVQYLRQKLDGEGAHALRDGELVECFARARAEEAFAVLVERHGPMILGVCRRILQNRHDAEDAFQATFLVLARRAAALRKRDSLAAWLYGIAQRVALNMRRNASKRHRREGQLPAPPPDVRADLGLRELHAALDEELQRLPENNRQPLLLCYLEGLTQDEAARQLGWPRGTLKRRLERGRELLRARLTRRGLTIGAALLAAGPTGEALAVSLPAALGVATVRAAMAFAAHQALTATSPHVVALAEGVLRAMVTSRLMLLAAVLLVAFGVGTLGAVLHAQIAPGAPGGQGAEPQAEIAPLQPPEPQAGERAKAAAATVRRYEDLAIDLKMFPTNDFAHGRAQQIDRLIPKKLTDAWQQIYTALATRKDGVEDVIALLKHNDPKVRTLALAALFDRQDPRLLPQLAAMTADTDRTVPEVSIRRAIIGFDPASRNLLPEDFHEQTVGAVAKAFLNTWLQPAGYESKDFADYWAARKDRPFCTSWFLARLYYAGQHTTAFDAKRGTVLIRAVRKDIDALPAVDRDWTLLALAGRRDQLSSAEPGRILATTDELIAAGKRLGPDRLMDLLRGKTISTDPDLAPDPPTPAHRTRTREDMTLWVLRHAGKLLRAEDAPALLALDKKTPDRSPWWALAAAELQPARAREWLHEAIGHFAGEPIYTHRAYHRAEVAAGLWRIVGESETDYLVDWFFAEKVATNPHSTQTGMFLESIRGVRPPADRKLVARLVTDPRLDQLDYQSLRALAELVNGWTKTPVLAREELHPIWERGSWGPETDADRKVLAQWRSKLRDSVNEWKAPAPASSP
jgi:RNA polymerase sigma factor (sigma-70 family)